MVGHRHRFAGVRHILGRDWLHYGIHLRPGVGRIPMHVVRHMAVAVMPTLIVPIVFVAVMPAGILAIYRLVRETIRPNLRNAVRRLIQRHKRAMFFRLSGFFGLPAKPTNSIWIAELRLVSVPPFGCFSALTATSVSACW